MTTPIPGFRVRPKGPRGKVPPINVHVVDVEHIAKPARERWQAKRWPVRVVLRVWWSVWLLLAWLLAIPFYPVIGLISLQQLGRFFVRAGVRLQRFGY